MAADSHELTLYCGTRGAAVEFEQAPAKLSLTGSVLELPRSAAGNFELVVAGKKALDAL